jgi:hypothetical protein
LPPGCSSCPTAVPVVEQAVHMDMRAKPGRTRRAVCLIGEFILAPVCARCRCVARRTGLESNWRAVPAKRAATGRREGQIEIGTSRLRAFLVLFRVSRGLRLPGLPTASRSAVTRGRPPPEISAEGFDHPSKNSTEGRLSSRFPEVVRHPTCSRALINTCNLGGSFNLLCCENMKL